MFNKEEYDDCEDRITFEEMCARDITQAYDIFYSRVKYCSCTYTGLLTYMMKKEIPYLPAEKMLSVIIDEFSADIDNVKSYLKGDIDQSRCIDVLYDVSRASFNVSKFISGILDGEEIMTAEEYIEFMSPFLPWLENFDVDVLYNNGVGRNFNDYSYIADDESYLEDEASDYGIMEAEGCQMMVVTAGLVE